MPRAFSLTRMPAVTSVLNGHCITGVGLTALLALVGCRRTGVQGPVDVNVDLQNRGTVTGTALINTPYQDPNAQFVGRGSADIRLTTGDVGTIRSATYRTTSNSSGGFLIEVPAGSYNVYGCYKTTGSGGTRAWYGKASATVPRGTTVDIGAVRLRWEDAWGCAFF